MYKIRPLLFISLSMLALLFPGKSFAGGTQQPDTVRITFRYRLNSALLLYDYRGNKPSFEQLDQLLASDKADRIEQIIITGSYSPEGVTEHNVNLASKRATAIRKYILYIYPHIDSSVIHKMAQDNALAMFVDAVIEDTQLPRRDRVLEILNSKATMATKWANIKLLKGNPAGYIEQNLFPVLRSAISCLIVMKPESVVTSEETKSTPTPPIVESQEAGTTPSKNTDTTAPAAGTSESTDPVTATNILAAGTENQTETALVAVSETMTSETVGTTTKPVGDNIQQSKNTNETAMVAGDEVQGTIATNKQLNNNLTLDSSTESTTYTSLPVESQRSNKPLFAIKTNLLFDAATLLNVELEVPIGKRWSIAAEGVFPWWLWEKKQNCLQMMSGNLEGRYWFGNRDTDPKGKPRPLMTGWFAGLYAGGGYYDLEWNRTGYQGEFFIAAGISGGYAHTINKSGTLRMEYSLGVGYMRTNYRKYEAKFSNLDNSWHLYRQNNGEFSWLGPTRAKVSLVWLLNTNLFEKKGGRK